LGVTAHLITAPIVSLAILKVNWDARRKDYVDNFVPIVAECIRLGEHEVVSLPNLQFNILTRFGLRIPQNQLRAILSRVSKQGYIRAENRAYVRVPEKLAQLTFDAVQQQVVAKHEQVLNSIVTYAKERFDLTWSVQDAERGLYSYLESYQLLDTNTVVVATPLQEHDVAKVGEFVVGSFVTEAREKRRPEFDYFETIAKGDILATAMFLPDPNRTAQKFRKTYVYFDTSFLIYALGHGGEARQAPCVELLQLLYKAGADLRCFSHNLDEIRASLVACAIRMEKNQLADAYGPSIEYFIEKGLQPSEVRLRSAKVEGDLEALRVKVVETPPFDKDYMIDEQALADAIQKEFTYSNQNALWRDVSSISSVIRLRRGHQSQMVEECRAVFVTTNTVLVRAGKEFTERGRELNIVPPVLTDHALTNLLWLKMPMQAPDLPRKRIIAASFAAAQPDEQLWQRYLAEINKLKEDKTVSAEDYFLLRHSLQARAALMEVTLGDDDSFATGTVQEILEIVRTDIQRDVREKLEAESQRRVQAEADAATTIDEVKKAALSAIEQREAIIGAEKFHLQAALNKASEREQSRRREIRGRAVKIGNAAGRVLGLLLLALLGIGSASTFPFWRPGPAEKTNVWLVLSSLQALLLLLGVANLMWGTTVEGLLRRLELWLADGIERWLLVLSGDRFQPDTHDAESGPSAL
jgi:hypothetical protein